MIVNYNICDFCGNQLEITSGSLESGITVKFKIESVYETVDTKVKFKNDKDNEHEKTFCDKECFINFLKKNFSKYGVSLVEEIETEEEDEIKIN